MGTSPDRMLPARLPKAAIPQTYRLIAPTHDWLAAIVERQARQLGWEKAGISDGERVLIVAVGTGLTLKHVLQANPSGYVEGIDLTPAMLHKAQRRAQASGHPNCHLRIGDAYDLEVPDHSFDLIINNYMFDLLPVDDFVPVLNGYFRALRPEGRLVQVNMTPGNRWYNHIWEGFYRLHPALLGGCRGVETAEYLKEAGFTNVERTYVSQATFPSEVVRGVKPTTTP